MLSLAQETERLFNQMALAFAPDNLIVLPEAFAQEANPLVKPAAIEMASDPFLAARELAAQAGYGVDETVILPFDAGKPYVPPTHVPGLAFGTSTLG